MVLVALLVLMPASVASAHDPIILTSEQTTPASGPLIVDGTISFALYGSLESSTDTRGFRVQFQEDDPLYLSILIPDLAPENELGNDLLPTLEVLDPTGEVSTFEPTERVTFAEPYTGTNYVQLLEYEGVALGGIYEITIKGKAASRFTVSVGKIEQFGTAVEDIDNRDLGVAGVMDWYMPEVTDDVVAPADSSATTSDSSTSMLLVVFVEKIQINLTLAANLNINNSRFNDEFFGSILHFCCVYNNSKHLLFNLYISIFFKKKNKKTNCISCFSHYFR